MNLEMSKLSDSLGSELSGNITLLDSFFYLLTSEDWQKMEDQCFCANQLS